MSPAIVIIKDVSQNDRRYQILRQICHLELSEAISTQCITAIEVRSEWITITTSGRELAQVIMTELQRTFDLTEVQITQAPALAEPMHDGA